MNINQQKLIKISHITIKNYKGIELLQMDFSAPRLSDDPDILIMGSENGLGKTSIIECCALLLTALSIRERRFKLRDRYSVIDIPDLLIKSGENAAEISGDIVVDETVLSIEMRVDRNGIIKITNNKSNEVLPEDYAPDSDGLPDDLIKDICGFTSNPVLQNTFLLFHSYRKVQEGNPELGMMIGESNTNRRFLGQYKRPMVPISEFKLQILKSMMKQADLFELSREQEPDDTIEKLNDLVKFYAGGTISKLRPSADNTVDFRIAPVDGSNSITFDGLSSGQKEIISTLFLIWYHTKNKPCVVFIDEPELHLNAQWHRSFVKQVIKLAPKNQYIIATHSEDVMDSVEEDRRILLLNDQGRIE